MLKYIITFIYIQIQGGLVHKAFKKVTDDAKYEQDKSHKVHVIFIVGNLSFVSE